jgi:1-acyl-sn-glycerol-3-phosphate acyltransferase
LAFNFAFYVNLIGRMIIFTPFYFLTTREKAWSVPKNWALSNHALLKSIAGTDYQIDGMENLPEGSFIFAPKHQSFWDAYAFVPWIKDSLYILKRELMWIPMFGWYVGRMKMIPIHRGSRSKALKQAVNAARDQMQYGRQLVIYPEGTRRPPGDEPNYKYGIVELYAQLGVPVVAVAHQAGLFWPRRKFLRYPGTIKCRILPPIPAGLGREEFLQRLIDITETNCDELLVEVARSDNPPPFPPTALKRLRELGEAPPAGQG